MRGTARKRRCPGLRTSARATASRRQLLHQAGEHALDRLDLSERVLARLRWQVAEIRGDQQVTLRFHGRRRRDLKVAHHFLPRALSAALGDVRRDR